MTDTRTADAFAVHALLEGCVAEVLLNDVPLVGADLRRVQASVHATPWIVDGLNELRIVVAAARRLAILPMGAVADALEAGPVAASARVMAGRYEDIVPDPARDPLLAEVAWGPIDDASRTFPASTRQTFTASGRPRWAWQDATILDPVDAATRAEVLAFVRDVHAAFAAGDGPAVVARMSTLVREAAHFGPGGGDLAAGVSAELTQTAADPGFALDPFDEDEVVLRPIAGGRVLRVVRASGGPVLRSAPTMEASFRFRLDIARIGGTIELARLA